MTANRHENSMDNTKKYIGESVEREGVYERVTGELKFTGDMRMEDMLHVKLVRIDAPKLKSCPLILMMLIRLTVWLILYRLLTCPIRCLVLDPLCPISL